MEGSEFYLWDGKRRTDLFNRWQKLRLAEVRFEKECKEDLLVKLTTQEREIRSRIEDILHPKASVSSPIVKFPSAKVVNGAPGRRASEDGSKKAKRRTNGTR